MHKACHKVLAVTMHRPAYLAFAVPALQYPAKGACTRNRQAETLHMRPCKGTSVPCMQMLQHLTFTKAAENFVCAEHVRQHQSTGG